jgi:hypothetical protein
MRKLGIVIAAGLTVVCGGISWTGYQTFSMGKELIDAGITRRQFDAQKIGAPETKVRAALPKPLRDLPDEEVYGTDPGRQGMPAGASCILFTPKPIEDDPDLWRFCFVDGALADKRALTTP